MSEPLAIALDPGTDPADALLLRIDPAPTTTGLARPLADSSPQRPQDFPCPPLATGNPAGSPS